jgi:hypothetical protein
MSWGDDVVETGIATEATVHGFDNELTGPALHFVHSGL